MIGCEFCVAGGDGLLPPGWIYADDAHIETVARFIRQLNLTRIDLLPYHNTGSSKYERLGRRYDTAGFAAPTPERLARIAAVLRQVHPNVTIGGH